MCTTVPPLPLAGEIWEKFTHSGGGVGMDVDRQDYNDMDRKSALDCF